MLSTANWRVLLPLGVALIIPPIIHLIRTLIALRRNDRTSSMTRSRSSALSLATLTTFFVGHAVVTAPMVAVESDALTWATALPFVLIITVLFPFLCLPVLHFVRTRTLLGYVALRYKSTALQKIAAFPLLAMMALMATVMFMQTVTLLTAVQSTFCPWHCIILLCVLVLVAIILRHSTAGNEALIIGFPAVFAMVAVFLIGSVIYHQHDDRDKSDLKTSNFPHNYWSLANVSIDRVLSKHVTQDIEPWSNQLSIIGAVLSSIVIIINILLVNQPVYERYANCKTKAKSQAVFFGSSIFSIILIGATIASIVLLYPLISCSPSTLSTTSTLFNAIEVGLTDNLFDGAYILVISLMLTVLISVITAYIQSMITVVWEDVFSSNVNTIYASRDAVLPKWHTPYVQRVVGVLFVVAIGGAVFAATTQYDGDDELWHLQSRLLFIGMSLAAPVSIVVLCGLLGTCTNKFGAFCTLIFGVAAAVALALLSVSGEGGRIQHTRPSGILPLSLINNQTSGICVVPQLPELSDLAPQFDPDQSVITVQRTPIVTTTDDTVIVFATTAAPTLPTTTTSSPSTAAPTARSTIFNMTVTSPPFDSENVTIQELMRDFEENETRLISNINVTMGTPAALTFIDDGWHTIQTVFPISIHLIAPIVAAFSLVVCLLCSLLSGGQNVMELDWNLVVCRCCADCSLSKTDTATMRRRARANNGEYWSYSNLNNPGTGFVVHSSSFRYAHQGPYASMETRVSVNDDDAHKLRHITSTPIDENLGQTTAANKHDSFVSDDYLLEKESHT